MVARPDGKLVKASDARWGKEAKETFLVELTMSANVRKAARAVGFSTPALYRQRIKDPHFAAAWDSAIETGKARVQAYLVEAATQTFDPDELPIGDDRRTARYQVLLQQRRQDITAACAMMTDDLECLVDFHHAGT